MPQHAPQRIRPFMPKQTFDQVSAAMWGRDALDYHTNYILARANWTDSDIREEALYFEGLARGLRLGAAQTPSQPVMRQGGSPVRLGDFVEEDDHQAGRVQPGQPSVGSQGSFGARSRPQGNYRSYTDLGQGVPPAFHNQGENLLRPAQPQHASRVPYGSTGHHDLYANAPEFLSPFSAYAPDSIGYGYAGSNQDAMILLEPDARANLKLPDYESNPLHGVSRFTGAQQPANSAAAKDKDQEATEPFGILSAPDGKMRSIPLPDDSASQPGPASQVLAQAPVKEETFEPTEDDHRFLASFEDLEDYREIYAPST